MKPDAKDPLGPFPQPLNNAARRELKARAQKLEPILKVGHAGLTPGFVASVDVALKAHSLIKIRFTDFKVEKKTLAPLIAEKTGSELIVRVGNVAVFYRAGTEGASPLGGG
jgi:RNA-binding protein